MTRAQANHLVEGDRVKTKELAGTVVGTTKNCVSIQWDRRATPEIFTADDMRQISKEGQAK
jgi:preprotein translocase subunit YajC